MTPKDMPPNEDTAKKIEPESEPADAHKHRKRGYRGYPNNPDIGGGLHIGSGFAGVGSTGGRGASGSGIITEKTRESVEELGEEEEEDK